jgi:pimeloyl-ACP methyl ester carboxylesterase
MTELTHRFATANGIRMHFVEVGTALVIMCHGHPECWYSWRHQLPALAAAGYRQLHSICVDTGRPTTGRKLRLTAFCKCPATWWDWSTRSAKKKAVVVGHDLGA